MGDDLEPQVSEVPEQAEIFSQPVTEPEPESVAGAPAPDPEQELPPVEPDWLSTPATPEPHPYYPAQQYHEPPPQPYPQQPQVPRGTNADAALQTFVDNPDEWFEQRIAQRERQMLGPIAQQQQQVAQMTAVLMNNYVTEGMSRADGAVKKAYEVFNRDASFRSDKEMQRTLQATLQGMRQKAEYEARTTGNFEPLRTLANLDESDMEATLAYMKAKRGRQSPGVGPLQVEGATVESSRAAVAEQGVTLTPDQEAAADRMGPGGRDRLRKAILEQAKYDDLEWKE